MRGAEVGSRNLLFQNREGEGERDREMIVSCSSGGDVHVEITVLGSANKSSAERSLARRRMVHVESYSLCKAS